MAGRQQQTCLTLGGRWSCLKRGDVATHAKSVKRCSELGGRAARCINCAALESYVQRVSCTLATHGLSWPATLKARITQTIERTLRALAPPPLWRDARRTRLNTRAHALTDSHPRAPPRPGASSGKGTCATEHKVGPASFSRPGCAGAPVRCSLRTRASLWRAGACFEGPGSVFAGSFETLASANGALQPSRQPRPALKLSVVPQGANARAGAAPANAMGRCDTLPSARTPRSPLPADHAPQTTLQRGPGGGRAGWRRARRRRCGRPAPAPRGAPVAPPRVHCCSTSSM